MLLSTPYTFKSDEYVPRYEVDRTIFQASKQIAEEAAAVLYDHNLFVIVRVGPSVERDFVCPFTYVPGFRGLGVEKIAQPALTIDLARNDEDGSDGSDLIVRLVTGPESLQAIIDRLWLYCQWDGVSQMLGSVDLSLTLHPSLLSRRGKVQKSLLEPFRKIHGFRSARISGIADTGYADHLTQIVTLGPNSEEFDRSFDYFVGEGEDAYRHGRFYEARRSWSLAISYRFFVLRMVDPSSPEYAEHPLRVALENSVARAFTTCLQITKAHLRSGDYSMAAFDLERLVKSLGQGVLERMNKLLRVQYYLCRSMAACSTCDSQVGLDLLYDAMNLALYATDYGCVVMDLARDYLWAHDNVAPFDSNRVHHACDQYWVLLDKKEEECDADVEPEGLKEGDLNGTGLDEGSNDQDLRDQEHTVEPYAERNPLDVQEWVEGVWEKMDIDLAEADEMYHRMYPPGQQLAEETTTSAGCDKDDPVSDNAEHSSADIHPAVWCKNQRDSGLKTLIVSLPYPW